MQIITRSPRLRRYSTKAPVNGLNRSKHSTPVNIVEFEDHFALQLAIPGFEKDQISIEFKEGDQLAIQGSIAENTETGRWLQREFVPQSFEKVFTVGETIDKDGISASYENGVLQIDLQKKAAAKKEARRTIEVF